MPSGPGGIARGLQGGLERGAAVRAQRERFQEQRAQRVNELRNEVRTRISDTVARAGEIMGQLRDAGIDPTSPRAQKAIQPLMQSAVRLVQDPSVQRLGPGFTPQAVVNQFRPLFQQPTFQEETQAEAARAATTTGAETTARRRAEQATRPSAEEEAQREATVAGATERARQEAQQEFAEPEQQEVSVGVELADGTTKNVEAVRRGQQILVPDAQGQLQPLGDVFPNAVGVSSQGEQDVSVSGEDVDVIDDEGNRTPATGVRVGQGEDQQILVSDGRGNFRPLQEVFPDAVRVEPARQRREEGQIQGEQFTPDFFVDMGRSQDLETVEAESGVGPVDFFSGVAAQIPVVGQTQEAIFGEEAGVQQRRARRTFQNLENAVLIANRPAEEGRPSNLQLQFASKRVPSFGAFSTERASVTDLKELRDASQQRLNTAVQVMNDPRFDDATKRDVRQRAISLGRVVAITDTLIQSAENPALEAKQVIGKRPQEASPQEIVDSLPEMSESAARETLNNLDEQTFSEVERLMGGSNERQ